VRSGFVVDCLIFLIEMILFVAGGIAAAAATKGLSDRPLETFGRTPMLLVLD